MNERNLVIGGIYKHFKGNEYIVKRVAKHTETGELFVIYANIHNGDQVWARPYDDFLSEVDRTKYPEVTQTHRFELQQNADGLKPCPFCGGKAERRTVIVPHHNEPWHYVCCGNPHCLVEPGTAAYAKQGGATRAWNRRVGES